MLWSKSIFFHLSGSSKYFYSTFRSLKSSKSVFSGYSLNQSGLINSEILKLISLTLFSSTPRSFIYFANSSAVIMHLRNGDDTIENFLIYFCLKIWYIYSADTFIEPLASSVIGGSKRTSEWIGGYSLSPRYPWRMNSSMISVWDYDKFK